MAATQWSQIALLVLSSTFATMSLADTTVPPTDDDDDFYSLNPDACERQRQYLAGLNALAYTKSALGAVGMIACGAALLVIVGSRKDRTLAGRMLTGVFVSNFHGVFIYATADIVPTNAFHASGPKCWSRVVGPRYPDTVARCFPAALMFSGVYMSVFYELMMISVSIAALKSGRSAIPKCPETAGHVVCTLAGIVAALVYFVRCRSMQEQMAALVAAYGDENFQGWNSTDVVRFQEVDEEFHHLPNVFWGWALVPEGVALVVWVYQQHLSRALQNEINAAAEKGWLRDSGDLVAVMGLDRGFATRAVLLDQCRTAIRDVVGPLQPFVLVIFAFAIPQVVGVSPECQSETERSFHRSFENPDTALPCTFIASMVLSFRAMSLAAVFFWDASHRAALFRFWRLVGKVWSRLNGGCGTGPSGSGYGKLVQFRENEIDGIQLVETDGEGRSSSFRRADNDVRLAGPETMAILFELDASQAARELATDTAAVERDDVGSDVGSDPSASRVPYELMQS